ncbi:cupin domain-containing protein [Cedecea colo]|uniref:Cupin domain-containing protein n=1 Tax=Cedecea colo TaxID=2552946 RepID=A0ABX0VQ21_9ENTR|nr:cupin domain-containing protein [Cedecea colo]NIY49113.1 cupin domain-containing protein [Cedecea colo]
MIVSKQNAEHYSWGGDCDGWHLVKGSSLSIIHEKMPAGRTELRHYHCVAQQFFFVLAGELTMELEGEFYVVNAGEGISVPPQARHQARNESLDNTEFLVISEPTTRGDRINQEA